MVREKNWIGEVGMSDRSAVRGAISAALRFCRDRFGVSWEGMSKETGIPKGTLKDYELRKTEIGGMPSRQNAERIARFMGLTLAELLSGSAPAPSPSSLASAASSKPSSVRRSRLGKPLPGASTISSAALGRRIREIRKASGIARDCFASGVGLSPSFLSDLENGRAPFVREEDVRKVSEALSTTPERLMDPESPVVVPAGWARMRKTSVGRTPKPREAVVPLGGYGAVVRDFVLGEGITFSELASFIGVPRGTLVSCYRPGASVRVPTFEKIKAFCERIASGDESIRDEMPPGKKLVRDAAVSMAAAAERECDRIGVPLDALASAVGVSVQTIKSWKDGSVAPTRAIAGKFAAVFGRGLRDAAKGEPLSLAPEWEAAARTAASSSRDRAMQRVLKEIASKCGLSSFGLSLACGVSYISMHKVLRWGAAPSRRFLESVSSALGTTPDMLLSGDPSIVACADPGRIRDKADSPSSITPLSSYLCGVRLHFGLTKSEMSRAAGVCPRVYALYETGMVRPSQARERRIRAFFHLPSSGQLPPPSSAPTRHIKALGGPRPLRRPENRREEAVARSFAATLRSLRAYAGVTRRSLSKALEGVEATETVIAMAESGRRFPSGVFLEALSKASGLSVEDLRTGGGSAPAEGSRMLEADPRARLKIPAWVGVSGRPDPKVFGRALRAARRSSGWTQQRLADAIGVSLSMVSRIESGGRMPCLGTMQRMSEASGTPLEDIKACRFKVFRDIAGSSAPPSGSESSPEVEKT